ncbi:MAG: hypothetical protein ABSF68_14565, partial [Candidatus Acidiferrales bacterium]
HTDAANTLCPSCGTLLVRRSWHDVQQNNLRDGRCPNCRLAIPGRWSNPHGATAPKLLRRAESVAAERYADLNL